MILNMNILYKIGWEENNFFMSFPDRRFSVSIFCHIYMVGF